VSKAKELISIAKKTIIKFFMSFLRADNK